MTPRRALAILLLVLAGLAACFRADAYAAELRGLEGLYQARYEEPQTLPAATADALERDSARCALSREITRTVTAPLFRREKQMVHVEAAGDPSLLFLPGRLVAGGFPADRRDCVVDEASARELWGSAAPLGLTVEANGVEYEVVGVVRAARPLLLTAAETAGFAFRSALFRAPSGEPFPLQAMQSFEQRLPAPPTLRDEPARTAVFVRFCARLPLWVLCLLAAAPCWRRVLSRQSWRALALSGTAILAARILRLPNPLPPELLPTQWSDFSFWRRQLQALTEWAATSWRLPGTLPDLLRLAEAALPALSLSAAALVAFLAAARLRDSRWGSAPDPAGALPQTLLGFHPRPRFFSFEKKRSKRNTLSCVFFSFIWAFGSLVGFGSFF